MRKRTQNLLICGLVAVIVIVMQFSSYAEMEIWTNEVQEIENVRVFINEGTARTIGTPRGRLLSSVALQISDEGKGTVGVSSDILCHEPMERITAWIYLEQWDTTEEDWKVLESEHFEWNASDYPDENLTMAMVSYNIPKQERGRDYRLRGVYGVKDLDSAIQESWSVSTATLFLE